MRIHHFFIYSPLCFILIFVHFHALSRDIYDSIHTINRKLKKNVSKTQLPKRNFHAKNTILTAFFFESGAMSTPTKSPNPTI